MKNIFTKSNPILKGAITFFCLTLISAANLFGGDYPLTDITIDAGLDSARGSRIWIADINNDGYPDLLWGDGYTIKSKLHVFISLPNPDLTSPTKRIFKDISWESGVRKNRDESKTDRVADIAALADVNNDGNIDIVTSIYYHRLQYYAGDADPGDRTEVLLGDGTGKFSLVENNGLYNLKWSTDLPVGLINATGLGYLDYNYDGNIDLYIATWWKDYAIEEKLEDLLFKGNGDGSFTKVENSDMYFVKEPMYGVNITDWDNDGWQDIITSPYCRSGGSLFKNLKNGNFADYSFLANYSAQTMNGDKGQHLCQWEANPADYNSDGYMDLQQVMVHGGYDANEGRTTVVRNTGAANDFKYVWELDKIKRDAPNNSHLGDQGACWLDVDGDGWQDVAIGQMAYPQANLEGQERLYICRQNDKGYFDDISKAAGIYNFKEGHSEEPADFDLDGDQDIFFSRQVRDTTYVDSLINGEIKQVMVEKTYMQITLLRNDFNTFYNKNHNWLSVKLNPPKGCNKSALGARITVYSGDVAYHDDPPHTQIQEIQAGLGHFAGQQPFIRNFGLGKRNRIDSLKIRWPRGDLKETVIKNPPLNLVLNLDSAEIKSIFKNWDGNVPLIAFSDAWLDMGTVDTGSSVTRTFQVINAGTAPLTVTDYDRIYNEYFTIIGDNLPFVLQPGEKKLFTSRFSPAKRAFYPAKIKFESNAFNGKTRYFEIGGYGFAEKPIIAVNKDSLNFGTKNNGTETLLPLVVSNRGELNLRITKLALSNETSNVFTMNAPETPFEIKPGDSVTVSLQFSPIEGNKYKDYSGSVIVESNGYETESIDIPVSGRGYGPTPQFYLATPLTIYGSVAIGESKDKALIIENKGDAELVISELTIADNSPQIYTILYPELPLKIPASASDSIVIRFSPDREGTLNRELNITSNDPDETIRKTILRGSGKTGSSVELIEPAPKSIKAEVSPNPLDEFAMVKLTINGDKNQAIRMFLADSKGEITIDYADGKFEPGTHSFALRGCCIPQGAYYLIVIAEDGYLRVPVMIIR